MRKTIILLLAVILALTAACHRAPEGPAPTDTPAPTGDLDVLAASDTDTVAAQSSHMPPASSTDAVVNSERFQLAYSYLGRPAAEMVAVIGSPIDPIGYTPSTIQEGALDGMYHYDGFYVVTLHTDTEELVREVYPGDVPASAAPAAETPAEASPVPPVA